MKLSSIFATILQDATDVSALFVHNPRSQAIEAVVIASAEVIAQLVTDVKAEFGALKAAPATK